MSDLHGSGIGWKSPIASALVGAVVWYAFGGLCRDLSYVRACTVGGAIAVASHTATLVGLGIERLDGLIGMTLASLMRVGVVTVPAGIGIGVAALAWRTFQEDP